MSIKVAVLRGGPSYTYDDSLRTGAHLLSILHGLSDTYEPVDIFISKDGAWHHSGLVEDPHKILSRMDVAWNTMHGPYGEEGRVQQMLESLHVPFVGSGMLASNISNNKDIAKDIYRKQSIPTPNFVIVEEKDLTDDEKLIKIFRTMMHPVIIKPTTGARALGVRIAHTFAELKDAVKKTFAHSPKALVEEYVRGTVSSCAVLENAKGETLYTFLPAYLKVTRKTSKPSLEENKMMEDLAKKAHLALGMKHLSSSDFVLTPKGKIYILETNAIPAFHENSLLHHSIRNSGWSTKEFVDHSLKLALGNL
ncbi:MAG: ATP-grasp domain-containing protein [Patescibacteria group bacterium]